ncbi:Protein of unknown function [Prauserella marina]|uniref:Uncharacterized protein n=1 Tax=Prauserella marina TaxID=530584 RepID=A0A1G6QCL9_9PSEU|nr:uncharacterized protein DUF742 [Prauserella marina]SDC89436.1 Protein of unknown function [Prauserella marina]
MRHQPQQARQPRQQRQQGRAKHRRPEQDQPFEQWEPGHEQTASALRQPVAESQAPSASRSLPGSQPDGREIWPGDVEANEFERYPEQPTTPRFESAVLSEHGRFDPWEAEPRRVAREPEWKQAPFSEREQHLPAGGHELFGQPAGHVEPGRGFARQGGPAEPEPHDAEQQEPPRFEHRSLVRPYARTGGRTRPAQELNLDTLVSTSASGRRYEAAETPEKQFICDLCVEVRSIAEIAAYARLPLGVVKVIVDDLARAGAVDIHQTGFVLTDRSSQDFMSRILDGLRAL